MCGLDLVLVTFGCLCVIRCGSLLRSVSNVSRPCCALNTYFVWSLFFSAMLQLCCSQDDERSDATHCLATWMLPVPLIENANVHPSVDCESRHAQEKLKACTLTSRTSLYARPVGKSPVSALISVISKPASHSRAMCWSSSAFSSSSPLRFASNKNYVPSGLRQSSASVALS